MISATETDLKYASNTDFTHTLYWFTGACLVIASLATSARCSTRYSSKTQVGLDDIFAIIAFLSLVANVVGNFVIGSSGAVGLDATDPEVNHRLKSALLCNLFSFQIAMVFGKFSLLFLYRRIFGMREFWFRCAWWAIFFVLGPIFITFGFTFIGLIVARDIIIIIHDSSNLTTIGYIVVAAICAFTNLAILVLPIGTVMGLQLTRPKKIGLILIFSLGSLGSATAFLRTGRGIQSLSQDWDPRYHIFENAMMDVAESTTLTLCASLPLIRPILIKVKDLGRWSMQTVSLQSRRTATDSYGSSNGTFGRKGTFGSKGSYISKGTAMPSEDEVELKSGVIICRTDYEVSGFDIED